MDDPILADLDLGALSDDALDALRVAVAIEKERRANLAVIPDQIRSLANTYRAGGGDSDALTAAIDAD